MSRSTFDLHSRPGGIPPHGMAVDRKGLADVAATAPGRVRAELTGAQRTLLETVRSEVTAARTEVLGLLGEQLGQGIRDPRRHPDFDRLLAEHLQGLEASRPNHQDALGRHGDRLEQPIAGN